jgi:hypothetical protein
MELSSLSSPHSSPSYEISLTAGRVTRVPVVFFAIFQDSSSLRRSPHRSSRRSPRRSPRQNPTLFLVFVVVLGRIRSRTGNGSVPRPKVGNISRHVSHFSLLGNIWSRSSSNPSSKSSCHIPLPLHSIPLHPIPLHIHHSPRFLPACGMVESCGAADLCEVVELCRMADLCGTAELAGMTN